MFSYVRWMAGPSRPSGGARAGPPGGGASGHGHDIAIEQTLLLDVIASLVYAAAAYGPRGECQYRRVGGGPPDHTCAGLLEAMQGLARRVATLAGGVAENATSDVGRVGGIAADITTATGRYRMRAIRLRPGLLGSESLVLVVADRLREHAADRDRIRERFGLTEREAEVAVLLADRRSNAEIARALGISVHTARHHIERVLLKLGGCQRRDVQRVLHAGLHAPEDALDPGWPSCDAEEP